MQFPMFLHRRAFPTLLAVLIAAAPLPALEPVEARAIFEELRLVCANDGGRLWGFSLDGPLMLVDRASRRITANHPDAARQLVAVEGVYTGTLPREVNIANTALTWNGTRWSMVALPLPRDPAARLTLLVHESWHREQEKLGVPASHLDNVHLDTLAGRLWLQVEMRALRTALRAGGDDQLRAARDAVQFRRQRHDLFPDAERAETNLENNEGLAEYTGLIVSGRAEPAHHTARRLEAAEGRDTFMRNFAYETGPAYGLLLDVFRPGWRRDIKASLSLATMLGEVASSEATAGDAIQTRAAAYDFIGLERAEKARAEAMAGRDRSARAKFITGPVLTLPLRRAQTQFDPNALYSLAGEGTVYPTLRLVDEWGVLEVKDGALIATTWDRAVVRAPAAAADGRVIEPADWRHELNPGWELVPAARAGDFLLRKK